MSVRHFVGDVAAAATPDHDRGLAYGDGLFETMRAHGGAVHWWPAHWLRLERGAQALGLALPGQGRVQQELEALLDGDGGVVKLIVTRGAGGRGYAPPDPATPHWILSRHDAPPAVPAEGLSLRWCDTRLAVQPALAGIKHCNRLEQVLARAEWQVLRLQDAQIHEGLMCSTEGDVVSATAANLFVLHDDQVGGGGADHIALHAAHQAFLDVRIAPFGSRQDLFEPVAVLDAGQRRLQCQARVAPAQAQAIGRSRWRCIVERENPVR